MSTSTPDPTGSGETRISPDRTVVVIARDTKHFRWRGTDGHDYRDQDVADWLPLVPAVSPAPDTEALREGRLWSVLDWSLWGNGLGDVLRTEMADVMVAAITAELREQAEACIKSWHERRSPSMAVGVGTQLQRERDEALAEVDRLKSCLLGRRNNLAQLLGQPASEEDTGWYGLCAQVQEREAGLRADLDRARRDVDRLTAAGHTYRESWMRVGRERDVLWDRATTAERQIERLRAGARTIPDDAAERLAAIKSRASAATAGPWQAEDAGLTWTLHGEDGFLQILKAPKSGTPYAEYWPNPADGEFIERSREDVAWLIDLVERLATPTTDPAQRLTVTELHTVLHRNLLANSGCTGASGCPAELHAHGCALDPRTQVTTDPAPAAADGTCSCNGGWVEDQNFQPEDYERNDPLTPGKGLIPCGLCNHGGWDADWPPAAPQAPAEPTVDPLVPAPGFGVTNRDYIRQSDVADYEAEERRIAAESAASEDAATPNEGGHRADIKPLSLEWHRVTCQSGCGWLGDYADKDDAQDDADQHKADTLRPGRVAPIRHEEE